VTDLPDGVEGHAEDDESGSAFGRILALSDGVFAIALTLLVLELTLPPGTTGSDLGRALLKLWPNGFAYFLSFFIIGRFWVVHHQVFRYIARYDGRLVLLNLLLLFFVAFLPFPTSVLGQFGRHPIGAVFYAASVAAANAASAAVWWYASGPGHLLRPDVDPAMVRWARVRSVSGAPFFVLTIPIALVAPLAALTLWTVGFPVMRIVISRLYGPQARSRKGTPPLPEV
jgi:uncharacterized membrane protein